MTAFTAPKLFRSCMMTSPLQGKPPRQGEGGPWHEHMTYNAWHLNQSVDRIACQSEVMFDPNLRCLVEWNGDEINIVSSVAGSPGVPFPEVLPCMPRNQQRPLNKQLSNSCQRGQSMQMALSYPRLQPDIHPPQPILCCHV